MLKVSGMKVALILWISFLFLFPRVSNSDELQNPKEGNDKLVKVECYSIDWKIRFCIAMTTERMRTYSDANYYCCTDSKLLEKLEKAVDQFISEGKCFGPSHVDVRVLFDLWYLSGKKVTIAFRRPYSLTINGNYCFDGEGTLVPFSELLPGKQGQRFKEDRGKYIFDEHQHVIQRKE